jgi:hypothetical protein
MARLYAVLHCFENEIRDYIRETLTENDGVDWWSKLPPKMKTHAESRQETALKDSWLEFFQKRILGIHLGISPYYRGSGTNFFPFVNNELGAVGYTLMNLNEGIDTGDIIHQSYANMIHGDSIHTIGTRLMRKMFSDIVKITHLENLEFEFDSAVRQPYVEDYKIYRKQDFTSINLELALKNISNQSIINFLENIDVERNKFPLVREINLNAT